MDVVGSTYSAQVISDIMKYSFSRSGRFEHGMTPGMTPIGVHKQSVSAWKGLT